MKMNIFILEDDLTQQYYIETIVEEIIEKHHLQYHHFVPSDFFDMP